MGLKSFVVNSLPFTLMVMVQCLECGLSTLGKAAMNKGMSHFVFVFYSNAIATFILLPISFVFERNKRPPLSFSLLCKFFLLSLIGITTVQNCVLIGVKYSSPTLVSAIANLIPAMTFLLAVIFRMEKLNLRRSSSVIKIIGTLVSITGALTITLYKGRPIGFQSFSTSSNVYPLQSSNIFPHIQEEITNNWVIGGLFLATASFCVSVWLISQTAILKGYPSELTLVAFYCLFGSLQCAVVSLVADRSHPDAWKLKPDIQLISIIYSAVCGSIITFGVYTWSIHKKGPVFVAMFKPFGIITTTVMSVIFLGDRLHVGTIIGAVIIIIGFYGVMWAQSKEKEEQGDGKLDYPSSTSQKSPLLQNEDV